MNAIDALSKLCSFKLCEEFEDFIKTYYLQSLKELNEMDSDDYERNSEDDREGIILNTEENIMTNVNMIMEDVDKKEIDKIFE